MLVNMFMLRSPEGVRHREREELAAIFDKTSEDTAKQLQQLLAEADVVLQLLNNLDTAQEMLHENVLDEKKVIDDNHDELVRVFISPNTHVLSTTTGCLYRCLDGSILDSVRSEWPESCSVQ